MLKEELVQVRGDLENWTAPYSICEDYLSIRMELAAAKAELKRLEKAKSSRCPSEECNAYAA